MAKAMSTSEVIKLLRLGQSVEDIVLLDIDSQRIGFRDAMLLAENGFFVPGGNIIYRDSDVAYDPDFDEVSWNGKYEKMADFLVSKGLATNMPQESASENLTIRISIKDKAVQEWLAQNSSKLEALVHKLVIDLYRTEQMLHSK
ncbi:MAG: hypothetical protein IPN20_03215 [Haliscomenobacter sp.]|nr:hypothetical protein [Haliscomenobacter sp.]